MKRKLAGLGGSVVPAGALVISVFAALFALMLLLTSPEHNTSRENGLYQFIFFAAGVVFSFVIGRRSARAGAADVLRPYAKGAVRRLTNLAKGMQALGSAIVAESDYAQALAATDDGRVAVVHVTHSYEQLFAQIERQILTTTDAMEDWREFVPEVVEAVERGEAR